MRADAPRLAMVAGEASGDLLAGLLLGGMRQRWPQLRSFGIGGTRMREHGFDAWWPSDKLAVRGYVEVLRHYREILGIRRQLARRLLADPPDVFIGVDAPDFNLDLEAQLKARGIRTVHFVSPSIWAWRGRRIERIARSVDHMLCVFPFEPELYARQGIPASYVGHPLADAIPLEVPRAGARQALGLSESDAVVALLPGSRRSEIRYIGPRFIGAALELRRRRPQLRLVLPLAPGLRAEVQAQLERLHAEAAIEVIDGHSHEVLAACDVALVASGTATLEAALFKRPMVIAYNMHALSWQLMKRMRYQPWVGLPNILCASFVVPELLQERAMPGPLADAVLRWIDDPAACAALEQRFTELHRQLRCDTAQRATDAIERVIRA